MYLHLSLMYPSWAAQTRFSIDFGVLGTWEILKKCHTVNEFLGFLNFTRAHQKGVQKAPKSDPREAKMDPRSGQEAPGAPREAPRAAQESPGAPQAHPRTAQIRFPSGLDGPPVAQ